MNELSYMGKLLDGVEVEWKELGEVCHFINGKALGFNIEVQRTRI